jgi:hypothetical protein
METITSRFIFRRKCGRFFEQVGFRRVYLSPLEIHSSPPRLGGGSVSRRPALFFGGNFPPCSLGNSPQATEVCSLRWVALSRPLRWLREEQPPRRPSAEPEARHVGCFLAAVGVPRFDPRPEGKGAGVQNAGIRAPVGRCLRAGRVWFRVVSAFLWLSQAQHREVGCGVLVSNRSWVFWWLRLVVCFSDRRKIAPTFVPARISQPKRARATPFVFLAVGRFAPRVLIGPSILKTTDGTMHPFLVVCVGDNFLR